METAWTVFEPDGRSHTAHGIEAVAHALAPHVGRDAATLAAVMDGFARLEQLTRRLDTGVLTELVRPGLRDPLPEARRLPAADRALLELLTHRIWRTWQGRPGRPRHPLPLWVSHGHIWLMTDDDGTLVTVHHRRRRPRVVAPTGAAPRPSDLITFGPVWVRPRRGGPRPVLCLLPWQPDQVHVAFGPHQAVVAVASRGRFREQCDRLFGWGGDNCTGMVALAQDVGAPLEAAMVTVETGGRVPVIGRDGMDEQWFAMLEALGVGRRRVATWRRWPLLGLIGRRSDIRMTLLERGGVPA